MNLYFKYRRSGLLVLDKIFKSFAYRNLCKKWPFRKVNARLSFFKVYQAQFLNVAYQTPGPLALLFRRRRTLKCFYRVWIWLICHVTETQRTNYRPPYPLRLHMKFGFDWPIGFWGEAVWKVFPIKVYVKQVTSGAGPFYPGLQFDQL